MSKYPNDFLYGKEVPPLVIQENYVLTGKHQGSVHVDKGELIIQGELQGSLHIHQNSKTIISGKHQGSVHLESGALLIILGQQQGSTHIAQNGTLIIEQQGRLAGSTHNNGSIYLRGVFGGSRKGNGEFIVEGGIIKNPIIKNGISYYEW